MKRNSAPHTRKRRTRQIVSTRASETGWTWTPTGYPVEFVSLSGALGIQLRATMSAFGPLLLGKVLSLNDTQTSVLTMVFKYADDQQLPLLDLTDLRAVLQWLASEEGIFAGTSSGLNVIAALRVAERLGPEATVATIRSHFSEEKASCVARRASGPMPAW